VSQPTTKVHASGKQAAVAAAAETPVFDVTPSRCTIQPGSHAFTTVTFSPVALQVHLLSAVFGHFAALQQWVTLSFVNTEV